MWDMSPRRRCLERIHHVCGFQMRQYPPQHTSSLNFNIQYNIPSQQTSIYRYFLSKDLLHYIFTSELTKVEAGERVGALPLSLVCWERTVLGRDRDPPSEGEETVLDHHCRVEATGEGGGTLCCHQCPLHLLCGRQSKYMSMRRVYTRTHEHTCKCS